MGGFDPYAALNRLHDDRLDIEDLRASTEERIREAARKCRCDRGSPGSSGSWTEPASAGAREQRPGEWLVTHLERLGWPDGWSAMVSADGDPTRASPTPPLPGGARAPGRARERDLRGRGLAERDPRRKAAGIPCVCVPNEATEELDLSEADLVKSRPSRSFRGRRLETGSATAKRVGTEREAPAEEPDEGRGTPMDAATDERARQRPQELSDRSAPTCRC